MDLRILLIDDHQDTLKLYSKEITRRLTRSKAVAKYRLSSSQGLSISVEEADSISTAISILESGQVDVVIVDLKMPGNAGQQFGGLEVISKSLTTDPLRPVIVITGYGSIDLVRDTFKQGVFDFIEKSSTVLDEILNTLERVIEFLYEKLVRVGNPFTPMAGIEPAIFGGRFEQLEFFEERVNRAAMASVKEHFLVLGEWGIGKSTLLKQYKKMCQNRGIVASLSPLEAFQAGASLFEVASSIMGGVLRDMPYPLRRFSRVLEFFDSFGISVLGSGIEISKDTSSKEVTPQAFLHDTLLRLWDDIKNETDLLIILLDDLDNLNHTPEIVMTLKQTLSMSSIEQTGILVCLSSTPSNWNSFTSSERHHPLARYFIRQTFLSNLDRTEVTDTINETLSPTGISFSKRIIDEVYSATSGHPFEMQLLCYHLFSNQIGRRLSEDVWDKSLQMTLREAGDSVFRYWLQQNKMLEDVIIKILASNETPIYFHDLYQLVKSKKPSIKKNEVDNAIDTLVGRGLISLSETDHISINDPLFKMYLQFIHSD